MASVIRKLAILLLVLGISGLHYTTGQDGTLYHIFYRELYFLPILLGAFWFGLTGGLATAMGIAVVYSPIALFREAVFTAQNFANLLEIVLFISAGVLLGFLHDREKRRQQQLREAESLAAMGKSVSAVAHEMKAPLAAIGGFARQIRRKLPDDSAEHRKAGIIADQTSRLETMIQDMLAFARPPVLHQEETDLIALITEGIEVARQTAEPQDIDLQLQQEQGPLPCQVDRDRFLHVLFNILVNAVEASPAGGQVQVRVFRNHGYAWLEVADQGPGISADQRQHIFEPFFTTKKNGTGLGLPIALRILEAHGGGMEIDDRVGGGTVFRLNLPLNGP